MAKFKSWDHTSTATLDRDGICASQTPASGGEQSLTIAGALASGGVATMDVARHVAVYAAGDESARTFTVTGTDRYGRTITETITGPNATTVAGGKNFKTVTGVTVDDDTAGAVEVGTFSSFDTPWYALDRYRSDSADAVGAEYDSDGALTFALEITYENVRTAALEDDVAAIVHGTITGKTASFHSKIDEPVAAVRFAVTGFTTAGATFYVRPAP